MSRQHVSRQVQPLSGCNAGLGYHAVKSLSTGADAPIVLLACRNTAAANIAAEKISGLTGTPRNKLVVLPEPCNLSEVASVRAYAAAVRSWLGPAGRIAALINNAGIGGAPRLSLNSEGKDMVFATNHTGHFLLTILLLPVVTQRIINVSSEARQRRASQPTSRPSSRAPNPLPNLSPAAGARAIATRPARANQQSPAACAPTYGARARG